MQWSVGHICDRHEPLIWIFKIYMSNMKCCKMNKPKRPCQHAVVLGGTSKNLYHGIFKILRFSLYITVFFLISPILRQQAFASIKYVYECF